MRYSVFRRVIASPYASASRLSLHGTAVASPRCHFSDIQHLVLRASRQCTVAFLLRRASELNPHASKSPTKNPTLYPRYHSDSTRRDRHHRTGIPEDSSRFRHHETIPTARIHLIILRSWVRFPPALLFISSVT